MSLPVLFLECSSLCSVGKPSSLWRLSLYETRWVHFSVICLSSLFVFLMQPLPHATPPHPKLGQLVPTVSIFSSAASLPVTGTALTFSEFWQTLACVISTPIRICSVTLLGSCFRQDSQPILCLSHPWREPGFWLPVPQSEAVPQLHTDGVMWGMGYTPLYWPFFMFLTVIHLYQQFILFYSWSTFPGTNRPQLGFIYFLLIITPNFNCSSQIYQ